MSSRREGSVYVGRLSKSTRAKDLEELFESYGRLLRCDIKYGSEMAYAFIDFEDRRDAEDCVKYENGRELNGESIIVEWAKGSKDKRLSYDECFRCRRTGHWARDCPELRWGRRGRGWSPPRRRSRSRDRRRRSRSRDKYRSRSRSRERRRSRSRSHDRSRRSRSEDRKKSRSRNSSRESKSPFEDRKKGSPSQNGSKDKKEYASRSISRSPSKSPRVSKSRSTSKSPRHEQQQLENHSEPEANGGGFYHDRDRDDDGGERESYDDQRSRSGSRD